MLALFLSLSFAACPALYAKKVNGFFMTSHYKAPGAIEIQQDENCNYDLSAAEIINNKWVTNLKNKELKDSTHFIEDLEKRVKALEDKTKELIK